MNKDCARLGAIKRHSWRKVLLPFFAIFCLSSLPWNDSREIPAPSLQPAELQPRANDPYSRKIRDGSAPSKQGSTRPSNLQCQRPKKEPWICDTWDLCVFLICFGSQKRHERAWKGHFTAFGSHQTTSVSRITGSRKDSQQLRSKPSANFRRLSAPFASGLPWSHFMSLVGWALHCHDDHGMYMRSFIKSHNFRACGLDMFI